MNKLNWLKQEVSAWLEDGLVSQAQAASILARYSDVGHTGLARLVFSVIGATLFGFGVILFFAWNWDAMSHISKLATIFLALLAAQLAGIWFRFRANNHVLGEGVLGLGTILFGAGIILIAQIYHIDEHYPNAFLAWGLGALAMAWAVASVAQGLIAVALLVLWFFVELNSFHHMLHVAAPLIGLGLLPLAWQLRSRVLFVSGTLAFLLVLLTTIADDWKHWFFVDVMLLAASLVLFAQALERSSFPEISATVRRLGYVGYLVLMYVFSFGEAGDIFRRVPEGHGMDYVYFALLLAAALLALILAARCELRQPRHLNQTHFLLLLVSCLMTLAAFFGDDVFDGLLWVWANVAIVCHSLLWIVTGSREQRPRIVVMAGILFVALVIPRFLDLFDSLLMRSLMFLLLGAALFLLGNFYQRYRTPRLPETAP